MGVPDGALRERDVHEPRRGGVGPRVDGDDADVLAPGDVQRAFLHEQAAQCGYCIPGMIARAEGLLRKTVTPTETELRSAMAPSLCRCGTHMRILRAVRRAAVMRGGGVVEPAEPVT